MLVREPYQISPVTSISASMADNTQAAIFSDHEAGGIAELPVIAKESSLLHLIDQRLSTDTSRVEIFVSKRQILDRTRHRPLDAERVGNAQGARLRDATGRGAHGRN